VRVGQGVVNRLQHRLTIAEDIVIPKPKHPVAALIKERRTSLIGSDLSSMVPSIKFHHEPMLRTAKINDVWADGMLPTKLGLLKLPVAQLPPKYSFAIGLPPAKPSGKSTAPAPLTCPLSPSRGEGSAMP